MTSPAKEIIKTINEKIEYTIDCVFPDSKPLTVREELIIEALINTLNERIDWVLKKINENQDWNERQFNEGK